MSNGVRGTVVGIVWSVDYDGKSVFDIMEQWEKMPFAHIKRVIVNEGGSIDDKGIIHRGTSTKQVGVIA